MNKRRFSRVAFTVKARVVHSGGQFEGEVCDLSLHGVRILTAQKTNLGEGVEISLCLAGGTSDLTINASGKVVRVVPEGVVVELDDMDLDSFIHLRNIVAYNSGNADLIDKEFQDYIAERGAKKQ
jgi:hypothetical protein